MGQGTPKEAFAGELPSTAAAEEALEEETNKEEEEAMQALSVIDTQKKTGYSRSTALFRRCVPGRGFPRHRFCKRRLQASILRRPRVGLAPGNEPNYVLPNFTKKTRTPPPPGQCPQGYMRVLHNRCYKLVESPVSHAAAVDICRRECAFLVEPRQKEKYILRHTVFAREMEGACVRLSGPVKSGTPW